MPLFRTAFAAATGALLCASAVGAPIQASTPLQVLPGTAQVPASPAPPPVAAPPVAELQPAVPAAPAVPQPALSITPAQAAALQAISEGQREAAKRQAEEQRAPGSEQSAAADAQREARKAEAGARHEAVRREAEARQQEQQKRIEEQQAAAQRDREAQRAAIEQSQKARPERPAAEGVARPTVEQWEQYQADLQKWREERAAQMAEQRRRLQERLDAAIDRMPSPPMVRPQEPVRDRAPPGGPFSGEYSAPAYPQADPPRYWYPAYGYGPSAVPFQRCAWQLRVRPRRRAVPRRLGHPGGPAGVRHALRPSCGARRLGPSRRRAHSPQPWASRAACACRSSAAASSLLSRRRGSGTSGGTLRR